MPAATRSVRMLVSYHCVVSGVLIAMFAMPLWAATEMLPSSPDTYLSQAARVRQSNDRPWAPDAGQLGNLRHLQITAADCTVRIVSGSENRVFPGTRGVIVAEQSCVLDSNPSEQPPPRDVVLAPDHRQACPGPGSCGVSITSVTRAPSTGDAGEVCFTVQIATAHDLLVGGDGLTLLVDRMHQPALRIAINPSSRLQLWLEQVELGLLSIKANASARVGGTGHVDYLQADSSSGGSTMYLHEFQAKNVGVSTTTTGTHWSVRTGDDTKVGYYQPARAPGKITENYGIEIDGPIDRLEVPVGHVDPHPISDATRAEARSLRVDVLARAGPSPRLPTSDPGLPSANVLAAALPESTRERLARIITRYLPASVKITDIALWKQGGHLEGIAPDAATARDIGRLLTNSGEFTYVSGGGGVPRDGGQAFSIQLSFSCDAPGEPSTCPAGDPAALGAYSEAQVRDALNALLGPSVTLRSVRLNGDTIELKAVAPNEAEARAGLERLRPRPEFFRLSTSTFGASRSGSFTDVGATLKLSCAVPPKPDGICTPRIAAMP